MPHCNHYCPYSFAFPYGYSSSLQFLFYFPFLVKMNVKKINSPVYHISKHLIEKVLFRENEKQTSITQQVSCNLFPAVSFSITMP